MRTLPSLGLLALLAYSPVAEGQFVAPASGRLEGYVLRDDGRPIEGARIRIGNKHVATTGREGAFRLKGTTD